MTTEDDRTPRLPVTPEAASAPEMASRRRFGRRRLLSYGIGGTVLVAAAGTAGVELVLHGVLPGRKLLNQIDGACDVRSPSLKFSPLGPSISASFYSRARHRSVGYTIAYPPAHGPGDRLPLVVMLHGFGGDHTNALAGMTPAQALALHVGHEPLAPMAMVTADGGGGYWNPHPGDDPMAMVVEELIPLCQRRDLGQAPQRIGTMGISMGGYGAIFIAERYPRLISAVAAISPAIWTSYQQANAANAGAYASAADFAKDDAVTHTAALKDTAVRVASGDSDPFHPGVEVLARVLPAGAVVEFPQGCHTSAFFVAQEPPSLEFLAEHLVG